MFRIGEFSKLTQVTVRMLRYYDETGLLKPARTDPWTGYRLYSVEQIPVLNKIIYLRDSGFQVAEIAAALRSDDSLILELLDSKHSQIEQEIQAQQDKFSGKSNWPGKNWRAERARCTITYPSNQFPVIRFSHTGRLFPIIMPRERCGKKCQSLPAVKMQILGKILSQFITMRNIRRRM